MTTNALSIGESGLPHVAADVSRRKLPSRIMNQRRLTSAATAGSAFSLIEIMVAVTLLALIMVGLLAVFNHTQRALRIAHNQSDVFEGARAIVNLIARDFAEVTATDQIEHTNILAATVTNAVLTLPDGTTRDNLLQDVFFITHLNDDWRAIGYMIDRDPRFGAVASLHRFNLETNGPNPRFEWPAQFATAKVGDTNVHRVVDGIVHFRVNAYDRRGRILDHWPPIGWPKQATNSYSTAQIDDFATNIFINAGGFTFNKQFLPAYLELEVGMLEPQILRQFNAIADTDQTAAWNFFLGQVGKIHLFRQRIPIRNHDNPPPFDDEP